MKKQMAINEGYARALHTEMTGVFYDFLEFKIKHRENIAIGIKGETRSGKSLVGHSISWHIAGLIIKIHYPDTLANKYYNINNVCATESEYAYKVKDCFENSIFQVDEQRESKFQMGSVREELYIMDVQNIIAKANIHSIWIYPTDFIERNCQLGLQTVGKDTKKKMTKLLVYDLTKSKLGFGMTPLGYIVIPVGHLWTCKEVKTFERCDTFGEPLCPLFLKCPRFIAQYERKKNIWIQAEKEQKMGHMQEQRFKMGEQLARSEMFVEAPNQRQRVIIARNLFPQLTEGELKEIIEIAKMGITYKQLMDRVSKEKATIVKRPRAKKSRDKKKINPKKRK